MGNVADIVRKRWLGGLIAVEKLDGKRLKDFVTTERSLAFYRLVEDDKFHLSFPDEDSMLNVYAFEFSRFSIAAFQTMGLLAKEKGHFDRMVYSWRLVEAYYSAFYSAHALLRLTGQSITYLHTPSAKYLESLADGWKMLNGKSIRKGSYSTAVDFVGKEVVFTKEGGDSGGHQIFWSNFKRWLAESRGIAESHPFVSAWMRQPPTL